MVLSKGSGSLTVISTRELKKTADLPVGKRAASLAYCSKAKTAFVTSEEDGAVTVIDVAAQRIVTTIQAKPGIGQIRFPTNGRFGFVVNPVANTLDIIDSSSNRIVQTGDMLKGPYQISFSDTIAYIRHKDDATVYMIPLASVGVEGRPISVVDFEGGQNAPGAGRFPSAADSLVATPEGGSVLVANYKDKAVYYYEEGMAAPMGQFDDYGHNPRAVLTVDRSPKERNEPGYMKQRFA